MNLIPDSIELKVQEFLSPVLNFLLFISLLDTCMCLVITIIGIINSEKEWFDTFLYNCNYYFKGYETELVDNLTRKWIALPNNFVIIISSACFT